VLIGVQHFASKVLSLSSNCSRQATNKQTNKQTKDISLGYHVGDDPSLVQVKMFYVPIEYLEPLLASEETPNITLDNGSLFSF